MSYANLFSIYFSGQRNTGSNADYISANALHLQEIMRQVKLEYKWER
ncbi:hypothetical protein SAMN05428975_5188 [Mucilaginibacter sp. OK268]|nr:hypothetical protein SAMN05428975_5188 [Mucilaginibacter sp. OK268]